MKSLKYRVLLVEDHEDTRELVGLILGELDYAVATASTIKDALRLAATESFNLFIFDSRLPDGSGIELCKSVRKFNQETPIIFYSGLAFEADQVAALGAGAQAYLVKPVEISQLVQTVAELIAKAGRSYVNGRSSSVTKPARVQTDPP